MQDFSQRVREIPDFLELGILFKDITPLLRDPTAFYKAIDTFARHYESEAIDVVVGSEADGFVIAPALASRLDAVFVPIRKSGKLPHQTHETEYVLEYGTGSVAIHQDAFPSRSRVLLCDDVLATGGTLAASIELIEKLEGHVVGIALLIEFTSLKGREKLSDYNIFSLIEY